jgi:hypothetical protein
MKLLNYLPFALSVALAGCGSSSSSSMDGGKGGSGGSSMTGAGGGNGTCGDLPACVATLFNAGCFPSTSAGRCTKSMTSTSTSGTFTYCFANHTKLVIVSDNATRDQVQTYSNASGTCFTETVVPNGPYTYLDPSGTAVGSGTTTITDAGTPIVTITCTGGQPVVVASSGSCSFNISLCTTDPSCQ